MNDISLVFWVPFLVCILCGGITWCLDQIYKRIKRVTETTPIDCSPVVEENRCNFPPQISEQYEGCSRQKGHEGPCAHRFKRVG